ncbi:GNAT family acetyltransferase [Henriciella barbarensis]|uniref:GNAT family acetyltransferase n=1 Tax=Henriciella barbarensis TaxID=86342 RepID=A0A399R036_9PROT|nr:GNAT family acetyltransferase [Henriciella barbarensis]RIJ23675.1 GNAT family acetyltransferase [Henriciella barbarensis]
MTEQPALRPALSADGSAVVALWEACGLVAAYNPPLSDFMRAIEAPSSTILIAECGGQLAGSVMVADDGHRGWIYYLAVSPPFQRQGIAQFLISQAETWAQDRGVRKIQLMIRPSNDSVREFYNKAGYADTPRLVMAKWLDKEVAANSPEDRS